MKWRMVKLSENIIMCENLVKIYKTRDLEVMALQGLELTVKRGELMAIVGNSGSGKRFTFLARFLSCVTITIDSPFSSFNFLNTSRM